MDRCEGDFVDEDGPYSIEKNLEGAEECFSEDGIEEDGLKGGGEVGVQTVDTKGFVVR